MIEVSELVLAMASHPHRSAVALPARNRATWAIRCVAIRGVVHAVLKWTGLRLIRSCSTPMSGDIVAVYI
jgi:hypothetical protein